MNVIVHSSSSHLDTGDGVKLKVGAGNVLHLDFEHSRVKWVRL